MTAVRFLKHAKLGETDVPRCRDIVACFMSGLSSMDGVEVRRRERAGTVDTWCRLGRTSLKFQLRVKWLHAARELTCHGE
jgi:hypothetical protein